MIHFHPKMTPPGTQKTPQTPTTTPPTPPQPTTQQQHTELQELNQYSHYLDNLCIISQFCSLTSQEQYVEFFDKYL